VTAEDTVRRRVVVRGDVQGVFFRDSARKEAESRGLSGSVTNRSDGAVEAVFEGPREDVDALIAFCREGPSRAQVEDVEVTEEEREGSGGGFDVI
jgi:acylphosphatase